MTPQQKMQAKLEKLRIPYKRVHVYGSQIMITSWSYDAAEKWALTLGKFAKVRSIVQSWDYNKENLGTCLNPTAHKVWLTAAVI